MKYARAKRAKILFSIVKYANLWGFCCRRRRGCLKPGFHIIAPVATIAAVVERVCFHISPPSAETRFSTTAAIVATGAIIWKPGFSNRAKISPTEFQRNRATAAIIWKHRIASIAQKISLRQNTFFDDGDDSSDGSNYMETGLKLPIAETKSYIFR